MARRVVTSTLHVRAAATLVAISAVVALVLVTGGDVVEGDGEPTGLAISGQAVVPRGQVADAVFVGRGTALIDGAVEHDVLVVDGLVRITGSVSGDVTVLHGTAVLARGAVVTGDVKTSAPARISPRATVGGEVADLGPLSAPGALPRSLWFGAWAAIGWALLGLLLVVPRPVVAASERLERRPLRCLATGTALVVVIPVAVVIYALSLFGAVLGLLLAAAAVVGAAVGTMAVADALGRQVVPGPGRRPALVGWVALLVTFGLALLVSPVLALLLALPIVAAGLGSLLPEPEDEEEPAPDDPVDEPDQLEMDLDPEPEPEPVEADEPRVLAALPIS